MRIYFFRTVQNFRVEKLKMNCPVGIGINKILIQSAGGDIKPEFLAELTHHTFIPCLSDFTLAAGKFPKPCAAVALTTLTN